MTAIHIECFKNIAKKDVYLHLFSNMIVKSHERNITAKVPGQRRRRRTATSKYYTLSLRWHSTSNVETKIPANIAL
jgi:hypothetical protein